MKKGRKKMKDDDFCASAVAGLSVVYCTVLSSCSLSAFVHSRFLHSVSSAVFLHMWRVVSNLKLYSKKTGKKNDRMHIQISLTG